MSDYPADRDLYDIAATRVAESHHIRWAVEARRLIAAGDAGMGYDPNPSGMMMADTDRWQSAAERHAPDLYRTAATPVNPMPERAGVVHATRRGDTIEFWDFREEGAALVSFDGANLQPGMDVEYVSHDGTRRTLRIAEPAVAGTEWPARAEATAQRVADETLPDLTDEQWAAVAKAAAGQVMAMKGAGAADAVDDDTPTLPRSALRTWGG